MDALLNLAEWLRQERQRLTKQLAALDSGRSKIGEDRGHGWIDVTKPTVSRLRLHIVELNELLADYDASRAEPWASESSERNDESRPN
jgi:hypothetical protein